MIWLAGSLALMSLLAVLPAPAKPLWYVAIAAAEWGHWLAVCCVVLAIFGLRRRARPGAVFLLWVAAAIYISPVLRAIPVARHLAQDLSAAFGPRAAVAGSAMRH